MPQYKNNQEECQKRERNMLVNQVYGKKREIQKKSLISFIHGRKKQRKKRKKQEASEKAKKKKFDNK